MPSVTVSIPDEIYIKLVEESMKTGMKVSAIIRKILQKHFSGNININQEIEIKPALEMKEEQKKENPKKEEIKEDEEYLNRLKRASAYVKKIITKDGEVKEDQLQYILNKFKVNKFDLLQEAELYEPEPGIYKPIE